MTCNALPFDIFNPQVASGDQSAKFVNKHSDSSVRSYTLGTENVFVPFVAVNGSEHEEVKSFWF